MFVGLFYVMNVCECDFYNKVFGHYQVLVYPLLAGNKTSVDSPAVQADHTSNRFSNYFINFFASCQYNIGVVPGKI